MLFEFNGHSRKGGIYQIKNLINGTIYVGSAKRFKERWNDHKRSLAKGVHHTKYLQNSYSKHNVEVGNDNMFVFSVLEVMDKSTKEERLIREEWWIQKLIREGLELYNSNRNPTKESKMSGGGVKGKRNSPQTEYKRGHIPWTKENGHDEETRKLIGEKSKAMWETPEIAEKLLKTRRSETFKQFQKKRMTMAWQEEREQRLAALNTPECKEAKSHCAKRQWSDPERRQRIMQARNNEESRLKYLITKVGREKAEKISDPLWLKHSVETIGKNGTAKLLGVDRGTISRWYDKFCKTQIGYTYEISSSGVHFENG
jgi:group I intron endonuclease